MWFLDPSFVKNQKYYYNQVGKNEALYGDEIDCFLTKIFGKNTTIYDNIISILGDLKSKNILTIAPVQLSDYTVAKVYPLLKNYPLDSEITKTFFGNLTNEDVVNYLKKQRNSEKRKELLEIYDRK